MSRPRGPLPWAPRALCLWAGLLVVYGCAASDTDPRGEPTTIRMAVSPYFTNAPLMIAEAEGYFADESLQVEFLEPPEGGSAMIPALAAGRVDALATSASTGLLNAIAHGARIRIVADRGHYAPTACTYSAIVARKGLRWDGTRSPAKPRRPRIAAGTTSHTAYLVEAALDTLDLALEELQFVDVPPPALLDAMERGALDFAHAFEPWVTHLQDAGHEVVVSAEQVLPDLQMAVLVFGPMLLERDRDAGRRFMRAYLSGVHQYNQGKTERNIEILTRWTGMDPEVLRRICWPAISEDGRIKAASLVGFQAWARRKGYVDRVVPEDGLWEPDFVEQAAALVRRSPL